MSKVLGYAAQHSFTRLKPFEFELRDVGENDVEIDILYCGVCHSDIHQIKNEWSNTVYPCVPGHEIVGRVRSVGRGVIKHAAGDLVGVGCMVDSCRKCEPCKSKEENYCEGPNSFLATYNGPMIPGVKSPDNVNTYGVDNTFGGYSDRIVVNKDFVLKIPPNLKPEVAAPILCAGVTTYSPLKHWKVSAGQHVGIIGCGGLGHMAAKIVKAMGAKVTVFTTTEEKLNEARQMGFEAVLETDKDALKPLASTFDFMLSTVPEKHDINPYLKLLKRNRTLCICGALEPLAPVDNSGVAFHRLHVSGSLIGSIAETQEILDFCAEHQIGPEVHVIPIQDINDAVKKVIDKEVRFRYVIDIKSLELDKNR